MGPCQSLLEPNLKNAHQSHKIKSEFFFSLRVDSQVDDNFLVSISLLSTPFTVIHACLPEQGGLSVMCPNDISESVLCNKIHIIWCL